MTITIETPFIRTAIDYHDFGILQATLHVLTGNNDVQYMEFPMLDNGTFKAAFYLKKEEEEVIELIKQSGN